MYAGGAVAVANREDPTPTRHAGELTEHVIDFVRQQVFEHVECGQPQKFEIRLGYILSPAWGTTHESISIQDDLIDRTRQTSEQALESISIAKLLQAGSSGHGQKKMAS